MATKSMLPLWAGGVVTHGQPRSKKLVIGITEAAGRVGKDQRTLDHLYRVTVTAEKILKEAKSRTETEVEDILISRSVYMETTKQENRGPLKHAVKKCANLLTGVSYTKRPVLSTGCSISSW